LVPWSGLQPNIAPPELAEEFGMLYVPGWSMDDYYINSYGYDLRELDFAMSYTRYTWLRLDPNPAF
jgi:hypothetical protein